MMPSRSAEKHHHVRCETQFAMERMLFYAVFCIKNAPYSGKIVAAENIQKFGLESSEIHRNLKSISEILLRTV
jgi:hypothetical protein